MIIPTACASGRQDVLLRAVESVVSQEGVDIRLIVVANGPNCDPEVYDRLKADERIQLEYHDKPSAPHARLVGLRLVKAEFVTFLDDDDELLPGALAARLRELKRNPTVAAVVTNGYVCYGEGDEIFVRDFSIVRAEPLVTLLRSNWIHSCGALLRTSALKGEYLVGGGRFYEWTYLAFRMLLEGLEFAFLDETTFRKHEERADALSKTDEYQEYEFEFLGHLLRFEMPARVRVALGEKRARSLNTEAERYRQEGQYVKAWKRHLHCLVVARGRRYLLYSRKLLIGSVYQVAKMFFPVRLRQLAKLRIRRYRLTSAVRAVRSNPENASSPKVLQLFIDGWGNEAYAANADYLAAVVERAKGTKGPILECGSGLTTLLLGLLAGSRGAAVWTFEHSADWLDLVKRELDFYRIEGVQICHTPLREHDGFSWYRPPAEIPERFGLVICDGPPERTTPGGRVGLVLVLNGVFDRNTVIVADDASTQTGKAMLARWGELGWSVDVQVGKHGSYAIVDHRSSAADERT